MAGEMHYSRDMILDCDWIFAEWKVESFGSLFSRALILIWKVYNGVDSSLFVKRHRDEEASHVFR
ncbi:predicted protein [Botrytis cinerea T4]|uniref:Uncharacterized protein n=1 Tax=Botryotinia fuckeliana (strain T4) TaxID=999810 RepID=G2XNH1_BOTF4|nr:predicted protein [Botrytis cinerea T4]